MNLGSEAGVFGRPSQTVSEILRVAKFCYYEVLCIVFETTYSALNAAFDPYIILLTYDGQIHKLHTSCNEANLLNANFALHPWTGLDS
jgi:hypothetical protein